MINLFFLIGLITCSQSITCVEDYFQRENKYSEMEAVLDYTYSKAISSGIRIDIRYEDSLGNIIEYRTE